MAITRSRAAQATPALVLVSDTRAGSENAAAGKPASATLQCPDGVSLVPTEQVLLLAVDLPVMPAAQRRAAVGFAVEDRIAQGLDEVRVVLGPQMSPGIWLVAVTARSVLTDIAKSDAKGLLWPDVVLLPVPRAGWAVWSGSGRVLVRLPDGTGFATSAAALPSFWTAAGSPAVTLLSGEMPASIPVAARADMPDAPDPALFGFNLRAGLTDAGGRISLPKGAGRLLAVLLLAALAHLTLLVLDTVALGTMADQRDRELRAMLNAPDGSDLDLVLSQTLAARQPNDKGGVLAVLSRVFSAIGVEAGRVSVQTLRYAASDDAIVLTVEAPDLATLQSVETALNDAGLIVSAGAATTRDGAAEVQMTIRDGGA